MSKLKDLTGQRFERLTVIERADNTKKGQARWLCKCDCGATCIADGVHLRRGEIKSCGCLSRENTIKRSTKHGMKRRMSSNKIYSTWQNVKQRCLDKSAPHYAEYGARGITICEEWQTDFQAFFDYVSKLEHFNEEGYTLDRINNDGNYEPGNVRWATRKEQTRNRRITAMVDYKGETISLADAAERSGINYDALRERYRKGLRGDELFKPLYQRFIFIEHNGKSMTLKALAEEMGVAYSALLWRYKHGKRGAELFT